MNDSSFPYTYKSVPYAGKPTSENGPYYIEGTKSYVKYFVNETKRNVSLKGRNISTGRLHTSIALANCLLENNITTVGTLNTTRIGVPDELKKAEGRDEFSVTCHFEAQNGKLCLNSYTVKTKSKGEKKYFAIDNYATFTQENEK